MLVAGAADMEEERGRRMAHSLTLNVPHKLFLSQILPDKTRSTKASNIPPSYS